MNKKYYVTPSVRVLTLDSADMLATSILNATEDDLSVILSDDEYNGEFSSRRNVWDED